MHSITLQSLRQTTRKPTPAQPQLGLTTGNRPDVRGPRGPDETAFPQRALGQAQLSRGLREGPKSVGAEESLNWGSSQENTNLQGTSGIHQNRRRGPSLEGEEGSILEVALEVQFCGTAGAVNRN